MTGPCLYKVRLSRNNTAILGLYRINEKIT